MKINIFYWCLMGMAERGDHIHTIKYCQRAKRPARDNQLKWCMLQQHNSLKNIRHIACVNGHLVFASVMARDTEGRTV